MNCKNITRCKYCGRTIVQRDIHLDDDGWADVSRVIGRQWTCFPREGRDSEIDHEPSEALNVLSILEWYEDRKQVSDEM